MGSAHTCHYHVAVDGLVCGCSSNDAAGSNFDSFKLERGRKTAAGILCLSFAA